MVTLACLVNQVRNLLALIVLLILIQIVLVAVCTDPCINGGTCTQPDVCECPEPYGGVTCADSRSNKLPCCVYYYVSLVVCNNNYCANGGTCEASFVGLTCR